MPTPNQGESQSDFVSRCIPIVIDDGTAKDPQQATAVCYSMWEQAKKQDPSMILSQQDIDVEVTLTGGLLTISNP